MSSGVACRIRARLRRKSNVMESPIYLYIDALFKNPCSYCGNKGGTLDHIVPKSSYKSGGPAGRWDNLTSACKKCNMKKGTISLLMFMLKRRRSQPEVQLQ